jgi:hypothetical protein
MAIPVNQNEKKLPLKNEVEPLMAVSRNTPLKGL